MKHFKGNYTQTKVFKPLFLLIMTFHLPIMKKWHSRDISIYNISNQFIFQIIQEFVLNKSYV